MLSAVLINHCHPDTPHVCATRMTRFAEALAGLGHRIVLLTETLSADDPPPVVDSLAADLDAHDWSRPFVIACPPRGHALIRRARVGELPAGLRQAVVLGGYLFQGGMFADWGAGAAPALPELARRFRPDIVWATFGNTEAWNIARRLAALAGCPWVADLKDNWSAFLPSGLADLVSRRYRDAALMTVFSLNHCDEADRWFPQTKTVVYSGFDKLAADRGVEPACGRPFRMTLTGSVYDPQALEAFVDGLYGWLTARGRGEVVFSYAGHDGAAVSAATARLDGLCRRDIHAYMPLEKLVVLQCTSTVNLYIRNPRCLFHHKVLELFAAGRSVLSFPGESREVVNLAREVSAGLFSCESGEAVAEALDIIDDNPPPPPISERLQAYSWAGQGRNLADVFDRVIGAGERR